jgi:hypothetical protein
MKNILLFSLLSALTLSLVACSKDESNAPEVVSDQEATEIMESAVSSRSGGMDESLDNMMEMSAVAMNGLCGQPEDTTFSFNGSNLYATYNYTNTLSWLLTCSNFGVPQQLGFQINASASFDAARWDGSSTATGDLVVTGLKLLDTAYIVNGTYAHQGNVTGTLRNADPALDAILDVTLFDLTIRKQDRFITGGNGAFILAVTNAAGKTRTVNGTLVFNGDGTATVTVGGYSHTFPI